MGWWKLLVLGAAVLWSLRSALLQAQAYLASHAHHLLNWLRNRCRDDGDPSSGRVLLVTAHPDDECMFFTPAIRNFVTAGWTVSLLCLTTGNADGIGATRREELERSCGVLGIGAVHIHDDEAAFPDSMQAEWDVEALSEYILGFLEDRPEIDALLTFDSYGVSGHPNHRSTCHAARLALSKLPDPIQLFELESVPLLSKYTSILGSIYEAVNLSVEATLRLEGTQREPVLVATITWAEAWRYTLGAMREHQSQLVWFRWLYLAFGKYCHVNSLRLKQYNDDESGSGDE